MKSILLLVFLALLSCNNAQDETALFQDALGAAFDYLSTESGILFDELGVLNPSVFSTFAVDPDDDVIKQDFTKPERKGILERTEFDIEESIRLWEKYKGKDLSVYVAERHLNFLIQEDSQRDRGTNVSFSAPIFNSDTSFFLFYMVFETKEENKENRFRQYMLFGKTENSWQFQVEMRAYKEN